MSLDVFGRCSQAGALAGPPMEYYALRLAHRLVCAQRESFDVIGKVGFGRDFAASRDIDNPVNTFQLISDNLEEGIRRIFNPFRKYSRSKVTLSLSSLLANHLFH